MKIEALHVENLLSFDTYDLRFDDSLTVLVGPNGAGKTNVVRMLDLMATALAWADERFVPGTAMPVGEQVLDSYAGARHEGASTTTPARVRLTLALTTQGELDRVVAFVQAGLLSTLLGELSGSGASGQLAAWVSSEVTAEKLAPMWRGALVLEHSGVPDASWEIAYEFRDGDTAYRWSLAGRRPAGRLIRADEPGGVTTTLRSGGLVERLFGVAQSANVPITLPSTLPAFRLDTLYPGLGTEVPVSVGVGGGQFDLDLGPHRRFAELGRIPTGRMTGSRTYSLARMLRLIVDDSLVLLGEQMRGVGAGAAPARPAGLYFWQELAAPLPRREPYALPARLFAMKNGSREDQARFKSIQSSFTALAQGRSFDIRFEATAMSGGLAETRQPVVDALGPYRAATAGESAGPPEAQQASVGAAVTVLVQERRDGGAGPSAELPIMLAGAGVWEALLLAEALTDPEDRVIVLDEPALNLHPTWQHVLRSWLKTTGGQRLLVTHSGELVSMAERQDLERIVRIQNESGATRGHRLPPNLDEETVAKIAREFALSADARALLFARAAILVEGETELGSLPVWFAQCASSLGLVTPEERDLGFCCVGSGTNFKTMLTVLHALGIPWALVCDGAAFDTQNGLGSHIFRQVCDAGVDAPRLAAFIGQQLASKGGSSKAKKMTPDLFRRSVELGREHNIFTLARGWTTKDKTTNTPGDESFEVFVDCVAPGQLAEAQREVGRSKVRQGLWVAAKVPCPAPVAELYRQVSDTV